MRRHDPRADPLRRALLLAAAVVVSSHPAAAQVDLVSPDQERSRLSFNVTRASMVPTLEVVHASAFDWHPPFGARYSVVWHDIWPNPFDPAGHPEMEILERRYAPYCDWQGSWSRECLRAEGQAEPR